MVAAVRTLVIGDVHGCLDELLALLDVVQYHQGADRLVFVGDLVDRGPDSIGVVRFVRQLGVECVLGNHEEKHVRWAKREANYRATGKPNPMRPFSPELREMNEQFVAEDHIGWLAALPLYLRLDPRWVVVHAGFQPGIAFDYQKPSVLTHVRYLQPDTGKMVSTPEIGVKPPGSVFWATMWTGPESVLYGHNVDNLQHPRVDEPLPGVVCVGTDTGCVFGGHLTAAILDAPGAPPTFVQVPAACAYAKYYQDEDA
jgi:hypothetical protein